MYLITIALILCWLSLQVKKSLIVWSGFLVYFNHMLFITYLCVHCLYIQTFSVSLQRSPETTSVIPNFYNFNPTSRQGGVTCLISPQVHIDSLRPSDAIWRWRSCSTLVQVMACCLTAPSHFLNQWWLIISKFLWHSSEDITTRRFEYTNH